MLVTRAQFDAMFPVSGKKLRDKYFAAMEPALLEFQINTPARIAAFLGQVAIESGDLVYTEEIASGKAYDTRADLGNLLPEALAIATSHETSTGRFYKGVGFIQVTGYYNILACGKALKLDTAHNPKLLTSPENAWRSAAWFFNTHGCNSLADVNLIAKITKVVNGGYTKLTERVEYTRRNQKIMGCTFK